MLARLALTLAVMLAAFALPAGGASAQTDTRQLLNRIDRVERDLAVVQRQIYRGGTPPAAASAQSPAMPAGAAANLEVRVSQLEGELSRLTGRLEELDYEMRQVTDKLDRMATDTERRLQALETGGLMAAGEASDQPALGAAPAAEAPAASVTQNEGTTVITGSAESAPASQEAALSAGDPEEQYRAAFDLLRQREYDRAQTAFQGFLDTHPDHVRAENARYWLGEVRYVRKDFQGAAVLFAEGYKAHPEGAKAADNLLKLGLSLSALNKKDEACVALGQLQQQFPNGSPNILRRAAAEQRKLGCS